MRRDYSIARSYRRTACQALHHSWYHCGICSAATCVRQTYEPEVEKLMPSIAHLLRPDIAALEPYTPVAPIEVLAERLGLPVERIIKLDANESPYGPSPRAPAALVALG